MHVLTGWRRVQAIALSGNVDHVLLVFTSNSSTCFHARSITAATALMLGRCTYRAFARIWDCHHARVAAVATLVPGPCTRL